MREEFFMEDRKFEEIYMYECYNYYLIILK